MAVDRVNNALHDRAKGLSLKRPEEIGDGEIVGDGVCRHVGDHDLYVPASVLIASRLETDASYSARSGEISTPMTRRKGRFAA